MHTLRICNRSRQAVCYVSGMTWSRRGHHCRKKLSSVSSGPPEDSYSSPSDQELCVLTLEQAWSCPVASLSLVCLVLLKEILKPLCWTLRKTKFHICNWRRVHGVIFLSDSAGGGWSLDSAAGEFWGEMKITIESKRQVRPTEIFFFTILWLAVWKLFRKIKNKQCSLNH
jgi:hypothetical protein